MLRGANRLMRLPQGDVDGHAHVFECRLPMVEGRRYTPSQDAGLSEFIDHLTRHGLSGGMLVQPSFLGTDNSYLVAALRAVAEQKRSLQIRGVATLRPDIGRAEVQALSADGIIGARFNLFGQSQIAPFDIAPWRQALSYVRDAGWHLELHCEGPRIAGLLPTLLKHADHVVIDHFGLPDPVAPLECPGQKAILAAAPGRVFVKASAPYRVFRALSPDAAARRCALLFERLAEALGPDQMIWGSDWPWTQFEGGHRYETTIAWLDFWRGVGVDLSNVGQARDASKHEGDPPRPSVGTTWR